MSAGVWDLTAYIAANIMTPEEADAVWKELQGWMTPSKPSGAHRQIMDVLDDLRDHPFDGRIEWQTRSSKT